MLCPMKFNDEQSTEYMPHADKLITNHDCIKDKCGWWATDDDSDHLDGCAMKCIGEQIMWIVPEIKRFIDASLRS